MWPKNGGPVRLDCGELLHIDSLGQMTRSSFNAERLYQCRYFYGFGYYPAAVSTNGAQQEYVESLKAVANAYGYTPNAIDRMSGKSTQRPELQKMMEYVRHGDTVIVESISRFARNTQNLLELVELFREREVQLVSLKEQIDTTTPTGKFMLTIFGAVAELEREYILQRQSEGIAIAKAQGKYTGRKPIERPNFG